MGILTCSDARMESRNNYIPIEKTVSRFGDVKKCHMQLTVVHSCVNSAVWEFESKTITFP